jgi:hypothetical protein
MSWDKVTRRKGQGPWASEISICSIKLCWLDMLRESLLSQIVCVQGY